MPQLNFDRPFVPGHEYVGEVLDYGPGSERTGQGRAAGHVGADHAGGRLAQGDRLFSHECPGGFGELMLLDEDHAAGSVRQP